MCCHVSVCVSATVTGNRRDVSDPNVRNKHILSKKRNGSRGYVVIVKRRSTSDAQERERGCRPRVTDRQKLAHCGSLWH